MSDPTVASPDDPWDARTYDRRFGFVADLGRDLIALLEPRDGERILDLGCGTGTLTAQLASTGVEVVGVDADPAMIARARQAVPDLRFHLADGQDLVTDGGRVLAELGAAGNVATIIAAVRETVAELGFGADRVASPW